MTTPDSPDIEILEKAECWELLNGAVVGRLAVIDGDHPDIFPINYVVHNGSVIFCTATGTKFQDSVNDAQVAFEIDGYNASTEQAWSVVLRGSVQEIVSPCSLAAALPLEPWQGGIKNHLMRIDTLNISGRRFRVTKPDIWTSSLGDARRASFE